VWQKGVQPTAAWDAEEAGGGCTVLQITILLQRSVSRGCKGSKRGLGQKQGTEVLCHTRQTLHWLLSWADPAEGQHCSCMTPCRGR